MELTEHQTAIMRHTISGRNRNWFGTDPESKDGIEFEKLVVDGLATKQKAPEWMGQGETIYRLTDAGRKYLIDHQPS